MHRLREMVLAGAGLLACLRGAQAQAPVTRPPVNPFNPPPVSPYLNLGRGGAPAINYYGLVRPQVDTAAYLQQLQRQQAAAALPPAELAGGVPVTGHPVQFMNFSHYYSGRITNPGVLPPVTMPPATLPPAFTPPAVTGVVGGFGTLRR